MPASSSIRRRMRSPRRLETSSGRRSDSGSLSAAALHVHAGLNIAGLAPGTIVFVTETISGGHATISVTLPAGSRGNQSGDRVGNQTGSQSSDNGSDNGAGNGGDAVGTITQLSTTGLTINVGGRTMTFSCDPADDLTDGFAVGDLVDVTYDSSGGSFQASDVEYLEADATGTVTSVDTSSLTLTNSDTGQTQTIVADADEGMFDGVSVGDGVVVTYHQSAGQLIAGLRHLVVARRHVTASVRSSAVSRLRPRAGAPARLRRTPP